MPNFTWEYPKKPISRVWMTADQYEPMDERTGLVYVPKTGEYCKHINGAEFEVMFKPEWMAEEEDVFAHDRENWGGRAEISRPPALLNTIMKDSKEKQMTIGGDKCHLCGSAIKYIRTNQAFKKKTHTRITKQYECGTEVDKSYKGKGEGYEMEDLAQEVYLGKDCVHLS